MINTAMAALLAWFLEAGLDTARGLSPAELASAGQSAARAAGITVSRAGAEPPTSAKLAG